MMRKQPGNSNYDEKHYVQAIAPLLAQQGFNAFFITDQGRSGKQPTGQPQWGDWCNAVGTGFGTRPTTNTGLDIEDAFVWVEARWRVRRNLGHERRALRLPLRPKRARLPAPESRHLVRKVLRAAACATRQPGILRGHQCCQCQALYLLPSCLG